MANQSTTGFGLRPLRNVHQGDHNAGLGEWKKAASTTAIDHHDLVLLAATGYVTRRYGRYCSSKCTRFTKRVVLY